jgi:protein phosphatase
MTDDMVRVFQFYSNIVSAGVSGYESGRTKLILPILPLAIFQGIVDRARHVFEDERMLLVVNHDVVVIGDLHGQILDLFVILEAFGYPPNVRYLFLGDLVDRGEFSTEVVTLVLTMKVLWPSHIFMIRGNHEFEEMWKVGGFQSELQSLYPGSRIGEQLAQAFAWMPVGALVDHRILCLHGGIGPSVTSVSSIGNLRRPLQDFQIDMAMDILWSDPSAETSTFFPSPRGTGHRYGADALTAFLDSNSLELLVRGHEVAEEGFEYALNDKVVTVFSASSYCGSMHNKAAVLIIKKGEVPVPRVFPPLKTLTRMNVMFVTCDSDTVFMIDPKKVAALRAASSKLPALGAFPRLARSGSDGKVATLPKISDGPRLPLKRGSIGGKALIIEPSSPIAGRRGSSGRLQFNLSPGITDTTSTGSSILV